MVTLKPSVVSDFGLARGKVLPNADAERFLGVHVFARARGGDGDGHVPVVRRGDIDRVHIRTGQHAAKVGVGVAAFVGAAALARGVVPLEHLLRPQPLGFPRVAHRHDLAFVRAGVATAFIRAATAAPDQANLERLVHGRFTMK